MLSIVSGRAVLTDGATQVRLGASRQQLLVAGVVIP